MSDCCAICLDPLESGRAHTTVCAHTFHDRCIQTLCARGERRDAGDADDFPCPFCRTANTYLWADAAAVVSACLLCSETLDPDGDDALEMRGCDCVFHTCCLSRHARQTNLGGDTTMDHVRIFNEYQNGYETSVACPTPGCDGYDSRVGLLQKVHVAQFEPSYLLDRRLSELEKEFPMFRICWAGNACPEFMEAADDTIRSMRRRMQREALAADELREFGERIDDLRVSLARARASPGSTHKFSPARAAASFDPDAQAWSPSLHGEELAAFLQRLREERHSGLGL